MFRSKLLILWIHSFATLKDLPSKPLIHNSAHTVDNQREESMPKFDLKKVEIELANEKLGTWTAFGQARTGKIRTIDVLDPNTGKWTIEVREDEKRPEISVVVDSYPKGRRFYAKGARYTALFKRCRDKNSYYCYISTTQIEGRSTTRKILNKHERRLIPQWISSYFKMRLYGNVVPRGKQSPAKDKLVAILDGKKPGDFAKFLIATRIWPLKEHYDKILK